MRRFYERQTFALWVHLLLIGIGLIMPLGVAISHDKGKDMLQVIGIVIGFAVLLYATVGTMQTEVQEDGILVTFGLLKLIKFRYTKSDILAFRIRQYKPLDEYGGWGIKGMGNHRVLNMKGNMGVELFLRKKENKKTAIDMMIGSQRAEELADALRQIGIPESATRPELV